MNLCVFRNFVGILVRFVAFSSMIEKKGGSWDEFFEVYCKIIFNYTKGNTSNS